MLVWCVYQVHYIEGGDALSLLGYCRGLFVCLELPLALTFGFGFWLWLWLGSGCCVYHTYIPAIPHYSTAITSN